MRTTWILAAAVGVCAAIVVPAGLASADRESAQEVIDKLQSEGYNVTIDKIGTAPISECVVTNVRNPQQFSQLVPYTGPGGGKDNSFLVPVIISQPISVSLDCSG